MSGFNNPVVGGQGTLIRSAIHSPDYVPGVSGWSINKDGTAEFNNVVIRGQLQVEDGSGNTIAGIDSLGNITGFDITANDDIFLDGVSLDGTLAALPQGVVAEGSIASSNLPYPAPAVNTEQNLFEIDVNLTNGRQYLLTVGSAWIALSTASRFTLSCYFTTDGTAPTNASALLCDASTNHDGDEDFNVLSPAIAFAFDPAATSTYRILVTGKTTGTVAAKGKATWQMQSHISGNELRVGLFDCGLDPGNTAVWLGGSSTGGGGTPKKFTKTYNAVHTYCYEGTNADSSPNPGFSPGAKINTDGNASQGDDQLGDNGNTSTFITWPGSVATDVSGATISSIQLRLNNNHSWNNSGMTVAIGKTTASVGGASRPSITDPDLVEGFVSEGASKTFSLNSQLTAFGNALVNGNAFCLYHAASSRNFYGYFAGAGQSGPPQLTVTYTK